MLNYADVAKALNVSIETVWAYAVRDADFPTRVNQERSPLFLAEHVDEYRWQRRERARGRAGHPPGVQDASGRVSTGRTAGDRIRRLMDAPDAPVGDVRALAGLLGLEVPALRYRLRGQTRWKPAELKTIARVFRVSIDELTGTLELV
ncbi:helix-turn-helix domain-containing protein [Curtobacterium sp. MCLR17_032]|uniref:helix-turn-helix domain-containing protein n=1 Tax=Curtobacterium sp. MCLR17_032 TaxID=2175650 RepID=UPI000DA79428|nr:helix-turn-helix domain-containing protein [Curtobacterium sp. MCLR17_032]WIE63155.1 helix-turn-helix domain-containing protein [Curtobacterium sp. MCLR17_032]